MLWLLLSGSPDQAAIILTLTGPGVVLRPIFHLRKLSPNEIEQLEPWWSPSRARMCTHGRASAPQQKAKCLVCWVRARCGVAGLSYTGTGSLRVLAVAWPVFSPHSRLAQGPPAFWQGIQTAVIKFLIV